MPTIKQDHVNELYAYITGIIKNKNSHLYRINGVENHLHILTDMHPSIALADFMREVKASSSLHQMRSIFHDHLYFAPSELKKSLCIKPPAGAGGYSCLALSEPISS